MGWEQNGRRTAPQGMTSRVVVAICGIATAIGGYAADKANDGGTATDVVAIAQDAGAQLAREEFPMAPSSINVQFAVDDASGTYHELGVASAGSDGRTDLYQISAPDTQEVACLAVSVYESTSDGFMAPVDVLTSVTSGPC